MRLPPLLARLARMALAGLAAEAEAWAGKPLSQAGDHRGGGAARQGNAPRDRAVAAPDASEKKR